MKFLQMLPFGVHLCFKDPFMKELTHKRAENDAGVDSFDLSCAIRSTNERASFYLLAVRLRTMDLKKVP